MIGISASALQRIELGNLKLSPSTASRISAVTDVDVRCLTDTRLPIKHASGKNYTLHHFERCQLRFESQAMHHECEYAIAELCDRISILLRAGLAWRRFPLVASDVWSAIGELRTAYGLERKTKELLRSSSRGPREKWTSIAPPGKIVFFDDKGYQLVSMSDNVALLKSRLSIGHESLAYGLTHDGFLFKIERAVPGSNRDAPEKQRSAPGPLRARLRLTRRSATRKRKA
jgi:hypothetical protein